jgi:4-aminobutyrate aminotransferase/(S)-3-amino-2-methylpropionate transaminase
MPCTRAAWAERTAGIQWPALLLGAIQTIEEFGLVDRAGHLESILLERLRDLASRHPVIGDIRGRGAMIAMEFVRPGTKEPAADVCAAVAKAAHAAGVVILTCGTYGNVIRLLPPLVIPEHLLHEGLDVLDEAIGTATETA